MKIQLCEGERIDDLQFENLKIVQNENLYSFTSDSVVLANFVKIKKSEKALEIGSGSGVISVLLTKKTDCKKIVCIEIQEKMCQMARKTLELNDIQDKIKIINDKAQNLGLYFERYSFDVIFSNPPYKKKGSAKENDNESRAIARHEKELPLEDLCKTIFDNLKFGGRAYLVYDADRTCELIFQLMRKGLQPKRMFFTENGKGRKILVVMECVKGGKPCVEVMRTVVTNDRGGAYIHEIGQL